MLPSTFVYYHGILQCTHGSLYVFKKINLNFLLCTNQGIRIVHYTPETNQKVLCEKIKKKNNGRTGSPQIFREGFVCLCYKTQNQDLKGRSESNYPTQFLK